MSLHWSLILVFLSIILFQISQIHSTPIIFETSNEFTEENYNEIQRTYSGLIDSIKDLLDEVYPDERIMIFEQVRDNILRKCVTGRFGTTDFDTCRRVVNNIHRNYLTADDHSDTSDERHGIQKRFFCNGFTGCRSKLPGER